MLGGYWLKALRVDLGRGVVWTEDLDESLVRSLIGGAGLASYFLAREVGKDIEPGSPSNLLAFATGPFQAMKLPGAAKFSICTRSPLTGGFTDSAAGGGFGFALKGTGYDLLLISGRSPEPSYLFVSDNTASILPAGDFWGKDSVETFELLSQKHGGASVAAIGPAGENLVAMSCVYVDG